MHHLNPAQYVIHTFGGVRATARALKRTSGAIVYWKNPRSKRGRGGKIPGPLQIFILELAKRDGLDITPNDLLFGRSIAEKK